MSEWAYVGAGFGVTWMVLAGYAVYLRRRVRRAEAALAGPVSDREGAER